MLAAMVGIAWRDRYRLVRVLAIALATLLTAACAHAGSPVLEGPVEIIVDLQDLERWEATGPLVEAGVFCPSGRRHPLAVFDPDTGHELGLQRYLLTFDDLRSPAERPDAIVVLEHVCDDGSGAFVAAENQHRGDWELRSGTGQYSGITGSGSASFVVDFQANPSEVHIVVELGAA